MAIAASVRKSAKNSRVSPTASAKAANESSPRLRFSVSIVTQGRHRFYTLTVPSDVLARTCFVTTRVEDPRLGFQRTLDKRRAEEIARYIDSGFGTIPSSIVLSAQPAAAAKILGGKTIEFADVSKAFLVLDGQHRIYGFSLAKTALRVPVVVYNNLSRMDESRLFIDINTKQRPVPSALLLDIQQLAEYQNEEQRLMGEVFDIFNEGDKSSMRGLLSRSEQKSGRVSRVTFNAALNAVLSVFEGRTAEEIFRTLDPYFSVWLSGLSTVEALDAFTKSVVFRAITNVFPNIVQRVIDRHGRKFNEATFKEILNEDFFRRVRSRMRKSPGNSVRSLADDIMLALHVPIRI